MYLRHPTAIIVAGALLAVGLVGCGAGAESTVTKVGEGRASGTTDAREPSAEGCTPTIDDGLSPSFNAGAPVRSSVGRGHVLAGLVVSTRDCSPIANAKLELWPEYAGKGHPDEARATLFTDESGRYRFECDPPEHIHMRISAAGYVSISQNSYHPEGRTTGTFDIALQPTSP